MMEKIWFERLVRLRWLAIAATLIALVPLSLSGTLPGARASGYLSAVGFIVLVNLLSGRIRRFKITIRPFDLFIQLSLDVANLVMLLATARAPRPVFLALLLALAAAGTLILRDYGRWAFYAVVVAAGTGLEVIARTFADESLPADVLRAQYLLVAHLALAFLLWKLFAWIWQVIPSLQGQKAQMDRLRALGAVAAGLSHELATPLNTIKLRLERLVRRCPAEFTAELAVASEAVAQCEGILRRLAATKLDAASLESKVVGLRAVLDEVCMSWRQDGVGKGRAVVIRGGAALRCRLPSLAISQIFLSFLDNAAEASADPAAPIEVHIEERHGRVMVAFMDRGGGIPAIVRRHFGEPFVTTKPTGTGLGLFNALALARALGGDLTLADREGGGAVVTLLLQAAAAGGA